MEGLVVLSEVDHSIEATHMTDIGLIHDNANSVALKEVKPSISLRVALFGGSFELSNQVDTLIAGGKISIGNLMEPLSTTCSEGTTITSTPTSIVPPQYHMSFYNSLWAYSRS